MTRCEACAREDSRHRALRLSPVAVQDTLLNRILSRAAVWQKFAVIVNEFRRVGIANDLIVGARRGNLRDSTLRWLQTVRGDLIRNHRGP